MEPTVIDKHFRSFLKEIVMYMKMDINFGHYVALLCKCMKMKTNIRAGKA